MTTNRGRPKPLLLSEHCKGCGRCIDACAYHCFEEGHEIHQASGLVPIRFNADACTACGLCLDACPEPYALGPALPDAPGHESSTLGD